MQPCVFVFCSLLVLSAGCLPALQGDGFQLRAVRPTFLRNLQEAPTESPTLLPYAVKERKDFGDTSDEANSPNNNTSFLDRAIDRWIDKLESRNISTHILNFIEHVTPSINRTLGLNDLTKLLERLPDETKKQLLQIFPDRFDMPFTHFWDAVASKWWAYQNFTSRVEQAANRSQIFHKARDAVKRYNNFMEWRGDLPFDIYDAKVEAFQNVTKPFYDARTRFIESRDAVLLSSLGRQEATWSPVVNASSVIGNAITERRAHVSNFTDRLILGRVTNTLYDFRSLLTRANTNRKYFTRAAKMCALNPICCEHPERCVPVELSQQA